MEFAIAVDVERIEAKINLVRKVIPGEGMKTIFRVPAHICRGREDLFLPLVVSIGPYHRGTPKLQKMEQVKWQFLLELNEKSLSDLGSCIKALSGLEERAKACYFDDVSIDSHDFIEMLLLDGCFIVQFLIKWCIVIERYADAAETHASDSELSDVFGNSWSMGAIWHDLFLLENQIPFFVLQQLFELISPLYFPPRRKDLNLQQMVFEFLVQTCSSSWPSEMPHPSHQPRHLLHFCHLCYTKAGSNSYPRTQRNSTREIKPIGSRQVYSANNLVQAGLTFRKRKNADTFFDIDLKNGILKIPFISIDEDTMHRLANLVALEQCDARVGVDITTYALLMDSLIDTPDDVEILRRKKILRKMMGSNNEVANFFNQLSAYNVLSIYRLPKMFEELDKYCKRRCRKSRATLMRDYFSNPWTSISVVVAFTILLYTASQSFMALYSGLHHRRAIITFSSISLPPILMIIIVIIYKMRRKIIHICSRIKTIVSVRIV